MISPQLLQYQTGIGVAKSRWRLMTQSQSKRFGPVDEAVVHVIGVPGNFVSVLLYCFGEGHGFHEPLFALQGFRRGFCSGRRRRLPAGFSQSSPSNPAAVKSATMAARAWLRYKPAYLQPAS